MTTSFTTTSKQKEITFVAPSISSSSRNSVTTELYEYDYPEAPAVYYSDEVWAAIRYLVDNVSTEVGWLGLVEKYKDTDDYLVTDLYVPKQEVHGAETDISAETLCDLAVQLEADGKESEKLIYWGHSHVNMDVGPSSQDESQIETFLENGCQLFIRGIYNKRGDAKVDIYDVEHNCIHQCVENGTIPIPANKELQKHLDKIIKDNVKKSKIKTIIRTPASVMTHQPSLSQGWGTTGNPNSWYYNNYMGYDDDDLDDFEQRQILTDPFGYKE